MALSAEGAAVNTAVDAAIAAWEAYIDSLADGAEIQIVKMKPLLDADHTGGIFPGTIGTDASLTAEDWDLGKKFKGKNTPDILDSFRVSIGSSGPLFFKVTNDAGDLT